MTCACEHPKPDFDKAKHNESMCEYSSQPNTTAGAKRKSYQKKISQGWEAPCLTCGQAILWRASLAKGLRDNEAPVPPDEKRKIIEKKQTKLF